MLLTITGQRHSRIIFDPILSQWNLTVANDPQLLAVSHAALSTLVIGKQFFIYSSSTKSFPQSVSADLAPIFNWSSFKICTLICS